MSHASQQKSGRKPLTVLSKELGGVGRASFRARRPGPEADLVDWFLDAWPVKTPQGCHVTVFREPRIEAGIPDLVLVVWDIETAKRWNPLRAELTNLDIRVMHFLMSERRASYQRLLSIFSKRVKRHLDRLERAEMISVRGDVWKPQPLTTIFATRNIVAIEAKITEWAVVLQQATLNTWFAPTSNVLIPSVPKKGGFLQSANARGIGVWCRTESETPKTIIASRQLPISYASWLFNEWTCQKASDVDSDSYEGSAR